MSVNIPYMEPLGMLLDVCLDDVLDDVCVCVDDVDDVLDVCWDDDECFRGGKMPAKSTMLAWVL